MELHVFINFNKLFSEFCEMIAESDIESYEMIGNISELVKRGREAQGIYCKELNKFL